ncbi:hypothetical protein F5X99DRAFT_394296 [Biscogniauxia marginata]|nr:hypothetical protein F5X99DRAFT_394296 [Biscogniauxia marginata]
MYLKISKSLKRVCRLFAFRGVFSSFFLIIHYFLNYKVKQLTSISRKRERGPFFEIQSVCRCVVVCVLFVEFYILVSSILSLPLWSQPVTQHTQ